MGVGDGGGTLVITGQVDQGSSDNKGMRLRVGMTDYTEGKFTIQYEDKDVDVNLIYDTATDVSMQPYLQLSLKNIPSGTLEGTLMGTYIMDGDIEGDATVNLTFSGTLMPAGTGTVRVPGNTTVIGTVTSGEGTYDVNIKI